MCRVWVCGRVFLCTQAGPQLNYVAKAGFTVAAILLPLPPRWSARMLGVYHQAQPCACLWGVLSYMVSEWQPQLLFLSCHFLYLLPFFKTGSLVGWELPKCASACLLSLVQGLYLHTTTHAVGTGDWTRVLIFARQAPHGLSHLLSPWLLLFFLQSPPHRHFNKVAES